jgi:hypothetical protein
MQRGLLRYKTYKKESLNAVQCSEEQVLVDAVWES